MTADLLETINRRAALEAVRAEAARSGLDAERLLDSRRVHDAAVRLDPDAPEFRAQVRDLVSHYSGAAGIRGIPAAAGTAPAQPAGANHQWTIEDVKKASPQEVDKAINDGLLADLGFNPRKKRR